MLFHIHVWGVNEIDNRELELLKKFKVTNISIWKKKDKDFYKKCKDFGFRVTSLFPHILNETKNNEVFTDTNQFSFGMEKIFEEKVCEDFDEYKNLIDEYIVTDIPWYVMIKHEKVTDGSEFHINPFTDKYSKIFLGQNNISLPYCMNVFNKKDTDEWLKYQDIIFQNFMSRFDFLDRFDNKYVIPISFRIDKSFNCSNIHSSGIFEEYVKKLKCDILLMNNTSDGSNWCKTMKQKYGSKILGGVEGALGLVSGNGIRLKENGFDGIIANEHHFFNNRHPTFQEIEKSIQLLFND